MLPELTKIRGVHPGSVLRRELKIRELKGSDLAHSINEHKQTISAILNKRRDINPKLSIKLSKEFSVSKDYFMILQASYDVKKILELEPQSTPNIKLFRKVIFWDTDINKIDWDKSRNSIIRRVLERGNDSEINEIIFFYGRPVIFLEIKKMKGRKRPSFEYNINKYNLI